MVKRKIGIKPKFSLKVDIGCKTNKRKGFIGIDILDYGQEIVWDVTQGIPLPDNSTSYIYMSHFLEHIEDRFMKDLFWEFYRVCKRGARIEIKVPHSDTTESYRLSHVSYWNEKRVKGIADSIKDIFNVIKLARNGMELEAVLEVNK